MVCHITALAIIIRKTVIVTFGLAASEKVQFLYLSIAYLAFS